MDEDLQYDIETYQTVDPPNLQPIIGPLLTKYRPVCIAQDGLSVLDDVGGLEGFVQFLIIAYGLRRCRYDGRAL